MNELLIKKGKNGLSNTCINCGALLNGKITYLNAGRHEVQSLIPGQGE